MAVDFTLIHDDPAFLEELSDRLRVEGHEVWAINDKNVAIPIARASGALELVISREDGPRPGIWITAIGLSPGYTGPLVKFLVQPVSVADVLAALTAFVAPQLWPVNQDRRRVPR